MLISLDKSLSLDKKAVIPAKAGNQTLRVMSIPLGSGLRRNDDAFAGMTETRSNTRIITTNPE